MKKLSVKNIKIVLSLNLMMTLVCFLVLMHVLSTGESWLHIAAAAIGFLGFVSLSAAVATEMVKALDVDLF